MRIAGILCEYNPFHLGHLEQIQTVKKNTNYLVCLMSGSFVQRGEPAIYDKFTRAMWALRGGADAVIELPCLYSLRSAEGFASGGMRMFDAMGIDTLYFGSECDLNSLHALADVYEQQPPSFLEYFRLSLQQGLPYAAAKAAAARHCLPDLPEEVFMRNAVLGVEYLLALRKIRSSIVPIALPRVENISASKARELITDQKSLLPDALLKLLPDFVISKLPDLRPVTPSKVSDALLYRLRTMQKDAFVSLPGLSEGLENRIYNAVGSATDYAELLASVSHKRMPLARIKRALMCALLGIESQLIDQYDNQNPGYMRLLGLRKDAGGLVPTIEEHSGVPVITQPARHPLDAMLQKEILATDVHALFAGLPAGQDFTRRFTTL